jgi:hypothetical protein
MSVALGQFYAGACRPNSAVSAEARPLSRYNECFTTADCGEVKFAVEYFAALKTSNTYDKGLSTSS